ncbi:hypothetical protein EJ02DRAFT_325295, partial [Clathrospora elynae]
MAWQANTDVSPCTDPKAVIEYVVKYATKAEKKSPSYRDLASNIIPFVNENQPAMSLVAKLLNKLIGDRNYSAQEVCHYLLNLPLKHSSRAFITVNLRPEDQHSHLYRVEGEETRRGLSVLEKYKERASADEDVTYIDFLQKYNHNRPYVVRTRAKARVLTYFPRYLPEDTDNFGRAKLLLHHPFCNVQDLLSIPEIHNHPCDTFTNAYAECRALCGDSHKLDGLADPGFDQEEEDIHEATPEALLDNIEADWAELARNLPNQDNNNNPYPCTHPVQRHNMLGLRAMDDVDWNNRVGKYPNLCQDWWKTTKLDFPLPPGLSTTGLVDYNNLERKQQQAYKMFLNHCFDWTEGHSPEPLLVQMEGEGGTGKTTVVRSICAALDRRAAAVGKPSPVLRAAPTGVASHNIGGKTLHSMFRLPVK